MYEATVSPQIMHIKLVILRIWHNIYIVHGTYVIYNNIIKPCISVTVPWLTKLRRTITKIFTTNTAQPTHDHVSLLTCVPTVSLTVSVLFLCFTCLFNIMD